MMVGRFGGESLGRIRLVVGSNDFVGIGASRDSWAGLSDAIPDTAHLVQVLDFRGTIFDQASLKENESLQLLLHATQLL